MSYFDDTLDTKAEAQAKIIVDGFFKHPRSKEEWDQIASINDKVSCQRFIDYSTYLPR